MIFRWPARIPRTLSVAAAALAVLVGMGCATTTESRQSGPERIEALSGLTRVDALIARDKDPFILFYHSPRCGFCSGMLRGMKRDVGKYGPKARIYTIDIDSNTDIRDSKGMGPVPVVVFYRDGQEVNRWRTFRPAFVVRGKLRRFFED